MLHTISATNARLIDTYIVIFIVHNLFHFLLSCSSRFSLSRASTFHFFLPSSFPFLPYFPLFFSFFFLIFPLKFPRNIASFPATWSPGRPLFPGMVGRFGNVANYMSSSFNRKIGLCHTVMLAKSVPNFKALTFGG